MVRPGDVLAGKYRVDRVLGQGGMGVVVAATHWQLAKRVAVKFLMPEAMAAEGARERFLREARAAVQFKGEHVARVMDIGTLENGAPFIVMEYLEGIDLSTLLRSSGPLPVQTAVDYVLQVCEALAEAHGTLGIVHRDLKPANLFLTQNADGSALIKVLDFGISKMQSLSGTMSGSITSETAVFGSPLYMSPEQVVSSRDVDHLTDIWALGVILHELVVGYPPFRGESPPAVMVSIAVGIPPPLCSERPDAPPELEAIVRRCLSKDRRQRFASVCDLALALEPLASVAGRGSAARIARTHGEEQGFDQIPVVTLEPGALGDALPGSGTIDGWGRSATNGPRHKAGLAGLIAAAALASAGVLTAILYFTLRDSGEPAPNIAASLPAESAESVPARPIVQAKPAPTPLPRTEATVTWQPPPLPTVALTALPQEGEAPPTALIQRRMPRARLAEQRPPRASVPSPAPARTPKPGASGWRKVFDDLD
jgi:tRNA A-37 threonylcarbamoyl transferase component Bud32